MPGVAGKTQAVSKREAAGKPPESNRNAIPQQRRRIFSRGIKLMAIRLNFSNRCEHPSADGFED